ncbi:LacI family DNA-binding transcriptional regulator [Jiella flava]|uniref:Substrate-binding domain-containing protein n=1 Tax=Jiella flava TaxID=2816857 RepID=A0A939FYF8_9HYPH|nr:substrate-binding domain-containing protein [Jiella flava]MBO0662516.1 substrate-binding domain-containing protein [Jiella flava]
MAKDDSADGEVRAPAFVNAKMVAERAGVSRSAVSRTFTDGASVSKATRRKVLEAAEALGYHVNHLARRLNERSNIVCLIVSDMTTPIRAGMVDALTRRLQAAKKITVVINTQSDTDSVSSALRQTLHYRADSTVVLSGTPAPSLIEMALANGQQVILINRDEALPGCEHLSVDNAMAAREAVYLLRRAGCSNLGLVTSTANTASLIAREQIFVATAAAAACQVNVIAAGPTGYEAGGEAARRLFGRSNGPDGVFCTTDLLALGFMDTARREFGLRIPDDLSIIGFDDIEQAGWQSYRLTTFAQPLEAMAAEVAARLTGRQVTAPRQAIFEPVPVWRKSVRPCVMT